MKCNDYLEDLSAYIDNELDEINKRELEQHLKTCETCQETLHTLEEVKRCMSDISHIELPKDFHSTMMGRLSEEVAKERKKVYKKPSNRIISYVSAIAAVLLIVWVGNRNETEIALQTPQTTSVENSQIESSPAEAKAMPKAASNAPLMTARSQMDAKESAEAPMSITPMSIGPVSDILEAEEWVIQVVDQEEAYMAISDIASENQFEIEGIPSTECIISLNEIANKELLRTLIEERLHVQIEVVNVPEALAIKIILEK